LVSNYTAINLSVLRAGFSWRKMDDMKLPTILEEYFRAKNAHDEQGMAACFADDAVVFDEGAERRGTAAIEKWIADTTAKYRVSAQPNKLEEENGETIVTAKIAGNFDGSPIDLRFCFTLEGEKIKSLAVRG
jgi:hypothetical protein